MAKAKKFYRCSNCDMDFSNRKCNFERHLLSGKHLKKCNNSPKTHRRICSAGGEGELITVGIIKQVIVFLTLPSYQWNVWICPTFCSKTDLPWWRHINELYGMSEYVQPFVRSTLVTLRSYQWNVWDGTICPTCYINDMCEITLIDYFFRRSIHFFVNASV